MEGVFALAGTPRAAVRCISAAVNRALRRDDIAAALVERGVRTAGGTRDAFRQKLSQGLQRWRRVVRDASIELP